MVITSLEMKTKRKESLQIASRQSKRIKLNVVKVEPHEADVEAKPDSSPVSKDEDKHGLNAYEKMVERNIQERIKFLETLQIDNIKNEMSEYARSEKLKVASRRGLKIKKEKIVMELRPRSLRLQNKAPDLTDALRQILGILEENTFEIPSGPLSFADALRKGSDLELAEKSTTRFGSIPNRDFQNSGVSLDKLRKKIKSLKIDEEHVAKVTPAKICSVAFHPTADRPLVFAGDTNGHLGIWDVNEQDAQDGVYVYRPHSRSLNCLKFGLNDPSHIFTLGYEGSIRRGDLHRAIFDEIFTIMDTDYCLSTYFDFLSESSVIASLNNGKVARIDFRQPTTYYNCIVTEKKRSIKTVSVHPLRREYFITSSIGGNISLWDIRNFGGAVSKPITTRASFRSTNSAFFSPVTGNRILATSLANEIRIYDTSVLDESIKLLKTISHNNYTGRWLTPFKAAWLPDREDSFIIGSMSHPRQIEVFAEADKMVLNGEYLSSICSINAVHPSYNFVAGGNSSGRVFVFK